MSIYYSVIDKSVTGPKDQCILYEEEPYGLLGEQGVRRRRAGGTAQSLTHSSHLAITLPVGAMGHRVLKVCTPSCIHLHFTVIQNSLSNPSFSLGNAETVTNKTWLYNILLSYSFPGFGLIQSCFRYIEHIQIGLILLTWDPFRLPKRVSHVNIFIHLGTGCNFHRVVWFPYFLFLREARVFTSLDGQLHIRKRIKKYKHRKD